MTDFLRIILIIVSFLSMYFIITRIRKSKVQIDDSLFWILFSVLILIMSIFPAVADYLTFILGIYSTVNFLFLVFIFLIIMKMFLMSIKISQLENKIKELTQKIALSEKFNEEEQRKGS